MSFGKSLSLTLGGLSWQFRNGVGPRIVFDVQRDKSRDPDEASIAIYNLNETSIAELEGADRVFCSLAAGYVDDGESVIFEGVLLDTRTTQEGPDFVTTCTLGDETKARSALARIHRTFPEGTPIASVLRELVKAAGLKPGNLADAGASARIAGELGLTRPYNVSGAALTELSTFARSLGFKWKIENGAALFFDYGQGFRGRGALLSSATGLSSASADKEGRVSFASRMLPEVFPLRPVRFDTYAIKGDYLVESTSHVGDTHGNAWGIEGEAVPFADAIRKGILIDGARSQ